MNRYAQEIDALSRGGKKVCLVIGDPVGHSLSPLMHNSAYEALGLKDKFIFGKLKVPQGELGQFLETLKTKPVRGVSVTIPHKVKIMDYLDEIQAEAKKIGAVNTLLAEDGRLTGYNTDYLGVKKALLEKTSLQGKKALIIGAGGAAKAAAYALNESGAKVFVSARSKKKAVLAAEGLDCIAIGFDELSSEGGFEIIVNATPIGLTAPFEGSILSKLRFKETQAVMDMVYEPAMTEFLSQAKAQGAKIVFGKEMLLYQACEQFRLYTGTEAPADMVEEAMRASLKRC